MNKGSVQERGGRERKVGGGGDLKKKENFRRKAKHANNIKLQDNVQDARPTSRSWCPTRTADSSPSGAMILLLL
jgi:hypothetical protein